MTHFTTESDSNKTDRQTSAHPAVGWSRKVVVTVRVTTLKGFGAGRYYTYHLLSYYLDVGEPPGRWWGKAADEPWAGGRVRLGGVPALFDRNDPVTGTGLGRRMGDNSVREFDGTFSAPKSVSVLFGLATKRPETRWWRSLGNTRKQKGKTPSTR